MCEINAAVFVHPLLMTATASGHRRAQHL